MKPADGFNIWRSAVAPFTGAWIETMLYWPEERPYDVAPFTGAWIETGKGQ